MNYSDFLIGGVASVGATIFTNPIEVIKTRIQLQGELSAKGTHAVPYSGVIKSFIIVAKNDGLSGLQKGLVPALYFQFILNSVRLGIYKTAVENEWINTKNGKVSFIRSLFFGAVGGVIGSIISSPFFLVKTQLQSQAVKAIAVGYQHHHTGMFSALKQIYIQNGLKGLWRGALATVPRATLGSGAQIATFGLCKEFLKSNNLVIHPTLNSFAAGLIAGSVMSLAITPPDVITTRLYNQGINKAGEGIYYKGICDCFLKVIRTEGIYGLYKGLWPNYLRIAPHSTLVLLFFDELLSLRDKLK